MIFFKTVYHFQLRKFSGFICDRPWDQAQWGHDAANLIQQRMSGAAEEKAPLHPWKTPKN